VRESRNVTNPKGFPTSLTESSREDESGCNPCETGNADIGK
jgi:hypothetical protein